MSVSSIFWYLSVRISQKGPENGAFVTYESYCLFEISKSLIKSFIHIFVTLVEYETVFLVQIKRLRSTVSLNRCKLGIYELGKGSGKSCWHPSNFWTINCFDFIFSPELGNLFNFFLEIKRLTRLRQILQTSVFLKKIRFFKIYKKSWRVHACIIPYSVIEKVKTLA